MTRFPLGTLDKDAVRDKAREMGLPNWDKADSEDICFVPNGKYADVVESVVGPERIPGAGPIVDPEGAVPVPSGAIVSPWGNDEASVLPQVSCMSLIWTTHRTPSQSVQEPHWM